MRYILALTQRATINSSPQGVGYEFDATEALKRHFVDHLDMARVVASIDESGKVASPTVAVSVERVDLDDLKYNELRELAEKLGLSKKGKTEEIRDRIRGHRQ